MPRSLHDLLALMNQRIKRSRPGGTRSELSRIAMQFDFLVVQDYVTIRNNTQEFSFDFGVPASNRDLARFDESFFA